MLLRRNRAVVQRLVHGKDQEEADAGQDGADAKGPAPGGARDDKGGDEGAKIGAEDDGELDNVDGARMLVEEEQVLDPHERAALAHAAEEAVEHARGQVRVEVRRRRRPRARTHHHGLEDQGDRQPAEVRGQRHHHQPAGADHEDVAHDGLLHGVLVHVPFATRTISGQRRRLAEELLQGLRDDGDDGGAAGVVGERRDVGDDAQDDPFLRPAPVERVVGRVERLGNQDAAAVGGLLQMRRAVRIKGGVEDVAVECLVLLVDFRHAPHHLVLARGLRRVCHAYGLPAGARHSEVKREISPRMARTGWGHAMHGARNAVRQGSPTDERADRLNDLGRRSGRDQ